MTVKFRDATIKPIVVPDHISKEQLSKTLDVLIEVSNGDNRVISWILDSFQNLTDQQVEKLCEQRPLYLDMRKVLAKKVKTDKAAKNLLVGNSNLEFRIELLKNTNLSLECKKSCLTKKMVSTILNARTYTNRYNGHVTYDCYHLEVLKNELPKDIYQWLKDHGDVKDIIT